jgi:homocysteine S-methyltransferase
LLLNNPDEIALVHRAYLESGADCIISSSYQATIPGLVSEGLSKEDAEKLIKKTVDIACDVRDEFISNKTDANRLNPLVAASIGPYGAYLANGAEYKGKYLLSTKELKEFHLPRWEILTRTSADIIACETIPSILEAEALKDLIDDTSGVQAWMTFSCKDGVHISDGSPVETCVSLLEECEGLKAIGVNCTAPKHVLSLISRIVQCQSSKKIIVYPNSGEFYDSDQKIWRDTQSMIDFGKLACHWHDAGARLIGGCCRTGPDHIAAIRRSLL